MQRCAWHFHHRMLVEPIWGDFETAMAARAKEICRGKPPGERATRLRLLKPVVGEMPPEWHVAQARLETVWAHLEAIQARLNKSGAEWAAAWAEWAAAQAALYVVAGYPAIRALHAIECPDCPWDGRTIFPTTTEVT